MTTTAADATIQAIASSTGRAPLELHRHLVDIWREIDDELNLRQELADALSEDPQALGPWVLWPIIIEKSRQSSLLGCTIGVIDCDSSSALSPHDFGPRTRSRHMSLLGLSGSAKLVFYEKQELSPYGIRLSRAETVSLAVGDEAFIPAGAPCSLDPGREPLIAAAVLHPPSDHQESTYTTADGHIWFEQRTPPDSVRVQRLRERLQLEAIE